MFTALRIAANTSKPPRIFSILGVIIELKSKREYFPAASLVDVLANRGVRVAGVKFVIWVTIGRQLGVINLGDVVVNHPDAGPDGRPFKRVVIHG